MENLDLRLACLQGDGKQELGIATNGSPSVGLAQDGIRSLGLAGGSLQECGAHRVRAQVKANPTARCKAAPEALELLQALRLLQALVPPQALGLPQALRPPQASRLLLVLPVSASAGQHTEVS